ncbi:MAG: alpha/beta fold hydrolase [Proteobacteria bacterium]|nr:alpha/beta fold hydrolase [Pseudomonadota bacterium]MDA1021972.1 alpha/beta fold hydrolase [Pseudomonadota bacterium]
MTTPEILFNGADDAPLTIALAHGAGAMMDSPFMTAFAEGLAVAGYRAARFEFPYMVTRRETGRKRPPDRAPILLDTWRAVIGELGPENLVIGGKSMGGRIASMVADDMGVRGLVCLGYPFHGPGKPVNRERLAHLEHLKTPALFCQGTRDTLGSADDAGTYTLSANIRFHWLEDGDHGFKPRKASGLTEQGHWQDAMQTIAGFLKGL